MEEKGLGRRGKGGVLVGKVRKIKGKRRDT